MNKVFLIGRITKDLELKTTPSGVSTTTFSVAVNRNFKNKEGVIEADFFNIVAWRRQAENVSKYCTKGSQICVEGRLQSRSYDAQDGTKRYVTEVIADNIEFLGTKKESQNGDSYTRNTPNNSFVDDSSYEETQVSDENPFKDYGSEVVLSDDDLPF